MAMVLTVRELLCESLRLEQKRPFFFWLISALHMILWGLTFPPSYGAVVLLRTGLLVANYLFMYPCYVLSLYRVSQGNFVSMKNIFYEVGGLWRQTFRRCQFSYYSFGYVLCLVPIIGFFFWPINIYATCLWADSNGSDSSSQLWNKASQMYEASGENLFRFRFLFFILPVALLGAIGYWIPAELLSIGELFVFFVIPLYVIADLAIVAQYIEQRK